MTELDQLRGLLRMAQELVEKMETARTAPESPCTCAEIQRRDPLRHFQECPLREESPEEHLQADRIATLEAELTAKGQELKQAGYERDFNMRNYQGAVQENSTHVGMLVAERSRREALEREVREHIEHAAKHCRSDGSENDYERGQLVAWGAIRYWLRAILDRSAEQDSTAQSWGIYEPTQKRWWPRRFPTRLAAEEHRAQCSTASTGEVRELPRNSAEQDSTVTRASAECPVCGVNEPHAHGSGEVESWVNALISRWGFEADVFAREGSRERLAGAWDKGREAASADACQDGWRRTLNPYRTEQDEPHTPDAEPVEWPQTGMPGVKYPNMFDHPANPAHQAERVGLREGSPFGHGDFNEDLEKGQRLHAVLVEIGHSNPSQAVWDLLYQAKVAR